MNSNKPALFAILSMMIADFCIVLMGHYTKELEGFYSALEIAFFRNFICLMLVTAWMFFNKKFHLLKTQRFKGHLLRSGLGTLNFVLVIWAYTLIPIVMVTTIMFTTPIMTLVFSILFLKEKAGFFRWAAVLSGFLGIFIVALPSIRGEANIDYSVIGIAAVLIGATGAAIVQIALRFLGKEGEPAITTIFYFMLFGTIALGIPVLLTGGISLHEPLFIAILCMGLVGLGNQVFKTVAYQTGEASLLAPFRYLSLIWAALIGYFLWDEIPTIETLIGAAIIIAANIVIVIRENNK